MHKPEKLKRGQNINYAAELLEMQGEIWART